MGNTAETLAARYQVPRAEQDRYALQSQQRYQAALQEDRFGREIVAVPVPRRKAPPVEFRADESPRADTSLEALAGLRPAFEREGTVTAGNASKLSDGAAAVLVMSEQRAAASGLRPLAWVSGYATAGVDPAIMGIGPAFAIRKLLADTGLSLADIDLLEVNEAFAGQVLAVGRELGWDESRVNVNGGAIALGHPLGASGTRIAVTLLHEMQRRAVRRGIAALCIGGGMGIALLLERD
jgi:acetyl-CoA C-acetyltransferase